MSDDRVKMICDQCGYSCYPQWLNDEAHCLKCNAVLRTRSTCHDKEKWQTVGVQESATATRAPGEVSSFKHSAASAMESQSGTCDASPDGLHHWKYGKCNYCQKAEGKLVKGTGTVANPGGVGGCPAGGKCVFKFAKCTKCGKSEFGGKAAAAPAKAKGGGYATGDVASSPPKAKGTGRGAGASTGGGYGGGGSAPQAPSAPKSSVPVETPPAATEPEAKAESPQPDPEACEESPQPDTQSTGKESEGLQERNARVRMECHVCGYKCVPQWMNDEAHCLKCHAILRTQSTIHAGEVKADATTEERNLKRQPGEVSTFKYSAASAMESTGGECSKSPDGVHHWKFGKCNYCQISEAQFAKAPGAVANPGGAGGCPKGGKCIFKFTKCTKCGKSELSKK